MFRLIGRLMFTVVFSRKFIFATKSVNDLCGATSIRDSNLLDTGFLHDLLANVFTIV